LDYLLQIIILKEHLQMIYRSVLNRGKLLPPLVLDFQVNESVGI
jgi:hypothetical protein